MDGASFEMQDFEFALKDGQMNSLTKIQYPILNTTEATLNLGAGGGYEEDSGNHERRPVIVSTGFRWDREKPVYQQP